MAEDNLKPGSEYLELGSSGLNRQGGWIYEEFLKELQGSRGIKTFKEMRDNDSTVGAVLFAIEMLIRQVDWRVEAASDDSRDVEAADFLTECMHDMSNTWEETISEILTMLPFGWAYMEKIFKKRNGLKSSDKRFKSKFNDNKIAWRKLSLRAQETFYQWNFDDDGGLLGLYQQAAPDYKIRYIPIEKALLFRTKTRKGNPEGVSILRTAYRDWYFKKHIENIEGIGIERDLAGLPTALVPPDLLKQNASPEAKATLAAIENIIKNIRRDEQEGLIFPKAYDANGNDLYEFKLLSSSGSRQFDTDKIIQRKDRGIAGSVLADFILLGHERVGSFALSSDKTNLFSVALGAWMDSICAVFNNNAVPELFEMNPFNIEKYPQIKHGDIETVDLEGIGNFLNKLTSSGAPIFPNVELENFLMRQAGLPEVDEQKREEEMAGFTQNEQMMINTLQENVQSGETTEKAAYSILTKGMGIAEDRVRELLNETKK